MLSGATLAAIPASTVAISARLFTPAEQGVIAVMLLVATFVSQLAFAAIVESRLSSAQTARRVVFPRWLAFLSVIAALALAFQPNSALALCVTLPIMLAGLEVGRGVSVAERLDHREIWASVAVGLGALCGVISAIIGAQWALLPLVAGILLATLVRSKPVTHRASKPARGALGWVTVDTAITGVVYPLLNTMILVSLGATNAVQFTAIATVSGLLAIPLNFMRLRLLKEHSPLDIVVSTVAVVGAAAALLTLELTGLLGLLFGDAWSGTGILTALVVACLWRSASLLTTLPFTALRRRGEARLVTGLRAGVSAVTFALAAGGLAFQNLPMVFIGLLVAELASALVYEGARRRIRGRTARIDQEQT